MSQCKVHVVLQRRHLSPHTETPARRSIWSIDSIESPTTDVQSINLTNDQEKEAAWPLNGNFSANNCGSLTKFEVGVRTCTSVSPSSYFGIEQ